MVSSRVYVRVLKFETCFFSVVSRFLLVALTWSITSRRLKSNAKKKKMQSQIFAICFYGNGFAYPKHQDAGRFSTES